MRQPVFYLSNRDRRDKFATETLSEDGDIFIKRALRPAGVQHVQAMLKTYEMIKPLITDVKIVPPSKVGDSAVGFARVAGRSGENVLAEAFLAADTDKAMGMLDAVTNIIGKLPPGKKSPESEKAFQEVFGQTYQNASEFTGLGLIDLNLDNFIIDSGGGWHLFDYEWCFDFAIPKDMLIERILFWFFLIRFQKLLLLHSAKFEMAKIAEGLFVPAVVYTKYAKHFDNMAELIRAELVFQSYVHIRQGDERVFDFEFLAKPRPASAEELAAARRDLTTLGQMQFLREQFELALRVNKDLESQLESIKQARSYKVARGLQKARGRLGRNK